MSPKYGIISIYYMEHLKMLKTIGYGIAAAAVVLACSADVKAQTRHTTVVNRTTVVNNNYGRPVYGYGYRGCGSCWVGPAVGGLAVGIAAGILIDRAAQPPQTVVVQPGYVVAPPPRDCITAVTGYDVNRNPIYGTYCR